MNFLWALSFLFNDFNSIFTYKILIVFCLFFNISVIQLKLYKKYKYFNYFFMSRRFFIMLLVQIKELLFSRDIDALNQRI